MKPQKFDAFLEGYQRGCRKVQSNVDFLRQDTKILAESRMLPGMKIEEATAEVLRQKVMAMGLDPTGKSNDEMEKVLAMAIWAKDHPGEEFPEEFEAMLASNKVTATRDWVNQNFKDSEWWIQMKKDGMRSLMLLNGNIFRMTSRNRSATNFLLQPHEDKVLSFQNIKNPFKGKTVLDGELLSPTKSIPTLSGTNTTTQLQAVVSLVNMPQADSFRIQQQVGSLYYACFDILFFDGEDVQNLPYEKREELCVAAVAELKKANPSMMIEAVPTIKVYDDPWKIFQDAIGNNEEGIMFKKRSMKYQQGKRVAGQQKLKAAFTHDAFITGFIKPTKGGRNENVIGGLIVSAYVDGQQRVVANMSGFTDAQRKEMTETDAAGNPVLKQEYYNRCLQFTCNNWSRTGKAVHAKFDDWRPDKEPTQCQMSMADITGADR